MLISQAKMSNIGPITGPIRLDFDPHVNVLIGPNACGKSSVLRILRRTEAGADPSNEFIRVHDGQLEGDQDIRLTEPPDSSVLLTDAIDYILDSRGMAHLEVNGYRQPGEVPLVFVPSIRLAFPTTDDVIVEYTIQDSFVHTENILDSRYIFRLLEEYHTWHLSTVRQSGGFANENATYTIMQLRSGDAPSELTRALGDEEPSEYVRSRAWSADDIRERKFAIVETAAKCAMEICQEIINDDDIRSHTYRPPDEDHHRGITEVQYDNWRVATTDVADHTLTIGDLSSGTQGPLMWIMYAALVLNLFFIRKTHADKRARYGPRSPESLAEFTHQIGVATKGKVPRGDLPPKLWDLKLETGSPESRDMHDQWRHMPFVFLIDEIENHLHPTWQRRVIPALQKYFPNIQIFATTHSPFVVAGLKAGQVHLLNRDEHGVVTATTNTEAIEGWTADEILRAYMGVRDPTDKNTAEAAAELRTLRDQGPLTEENAEEERQAKIRNLRQIVDKAELSGPRVAEDERFLSNLESVLERYRRSRDLNQENG